MDRGVPGHPWAGVLCVVGVHKGVLGGRLLSTALAEHLHEGLAELVTEGAVQHKVEGGVAGRHQVEEVAQDAHGEVVT